MSAAASERDTGIARAGRVNAWEEPYLEVLQFLNDEAACLDDDRAEEWLGMLAEDIEYRMPVRATRRRGEGSEFFEETGHFDDDYSTLSFRVRKNAGAPSSWSTNPPSRTRRFVTNIVVHRTARPDEFGVTSSILLTRTRWDESKVEIVSAKREDLLRRVDATTWRVARRMILVDQTTLATTNLAVFL